MVNNTSKRKRTQFSSCDACRHSRVACDALRPGPQNGRLRWRGSCSRCSRKEQQCTFEWINRVKKKPLGLPRETSSDESSPLTAEPADVSQTQWSSQIFHQGFDSIFGLGVGKDSCPFINDPQSDVCIPATKLFGVLDDFHAEQPDHQSQDDIIQVQIQREERDDQINEHLRRAIRAYTARWLSLIPHRDDVQKSRDEEMIRESWRATRKDMLKVINRASYRSVLALYLFSRTPIPIGISEDEELDGISGLVCIQTALLQIQRLRERKVEDSFHGSETSAWIDTLVRSVTTLSPQSAYLDLESRAYWAAVMWDTSSSLTSNFRSSLTSGLKGACSEPVWRLVRSFLVGSFHPRTEDWRTKGFEVSDSTASQILSAAGVCKLYLWKITTSLKEALREGVDEETLLFTWQSIHDTLDIFKTTIRPLLNVCERKLHFLDQLYRFRWYEVNLQYYLGIMIMVNTLEVTRRSDLLAEVMEARKDAEDESFNVVKFGIESTYTIQPPSENLGTSSIPGCATPSSQSPIVTSFITIDPYPHHLIDAVILMSKAIIRKHRQGDIKHETYSYLSSILFEALEKLPPYSKSAQIARDSLKTATSMEDH
ncbi:hypothetical protein M426DRAFT_317757 [Hypoxylon sp. CI-4A]|nr:hypothetical protein M426DRAFT_317757 [Hypoxylon sp. CI-4A]